MIYRLALAKGELNVETEGGLVDQVPPEQIDRWAEFFLLEPWGCKADDTRAGRMAVIHGLMEHGSENNWVKEADVHAGRWKTTEG